MATRREALIGIGTAAVAAGAPTTSVSTTEAMVSVEVPAAQAGIIKLMSQLAQCVSTIAKHVPPSCISMICNNISNEGENSHERKDSWLGKAEAIEEAIIELKKTPDKYNAAYYKGLYCSFFGSASERLAAVHTMRALIVSHPVLFDKLFEYSTLKAKDSAHIMDDRLIAQFAGLDVSPNINDAVYNLKTWNVKNTEDVLKKLEEEDKAIRDKVDVIFDQLKKPSVFREVVLPAIEFLEQHGVHWQPTKAALLAATGEKVLRNHNAKHFCIKERYSDEWRRLFENDYQTTCTTADFLEYTKPSLIDCEYSYKGANDIPYHSYIPEVDDATTQRIKNGVLPTVSAPRALLPKESDKLTGQINSSVAQLQAWAKEDYQQWHAGLNAPQQGADEDLKGKPDTTVTAGNAVSHLMSAAAKALLRALTDVRVEADRSVAALVDKQTARYVLSFTGEKPINIAHILSEQFGKDEVTVTPRDDGKYVVEVHDPKAKTAFDDLAARNIGHE